MKAEGCREWRERIGALVLGQLPEEERFATEAHLDGCPACRAEAEALAPVASLLGRADPERLAPAPAPPPRLGERIVRRIAAERRAERRRRTRLRLGLAAAARRGARRRPSSSSSPSAGSDQSTPSQTVAFRSLPRGAFAEATLAPRPWGSEVSVKVYGFRPGALCQVWLRRSDGKRVPAGSFRYVYDGEGDHLSSAVAPDDATAIGLRVGSKTYVAPLPPARSAGACLMTPVKRPRGDRSHESQAISGSPWASALAALAIAGCGGDDNDDDEPRLRTGAPSARRADGEHQRDRVRARPVRPRPCRPAPSRSRSRTTAASTTTSRSRDRRASRSSTRTSPPARAAR